MTCCCDCCWCCRPIGPRRPEPLSQKTMDQLQRQADELVRIYWEVHSKDRPAPSTEEA